MRQETVVWAYSDMDAARRLWPRVKDIIEQQVERGELELSISDQRRVIAAVVNDLLEQEKSRKPVLCKPRSVDRLLRRLRKQDTEFLQQQPA